MSRKPSGATGLFVRHTVIGVGCGKRGLASRLSFDGFESVLIQSLQSTTAKLYFEAHNILFFPHSLHRVTLSREDFAPP